MNVRRSAGGALLLAAALAAGCATQREREQGPWAVQESVRHGECVAGAALAIPAAGVRHLNVVTCGATTMKQYVGPYPKGTLKASWKNDLGVTVKSEVDLDELFRREHVEMRDSVLEVVYGRTGLELWLREPARRKFFLGATADLPAQTVRRRLAVH